MFHEFIELHLFDYSNSHDCLPTLPLDYIFNNPKCDNLFPIELCKTSSDWLTRWVMKISKHPSEARGKGDASTLQCVSTHKENSMIFFLS